MLPSASDKAKLFRKQFYRRSNFDNLGISLRAFPSRNNLKLYNIHVIPKWVRKTLIVKRTRFLLCPCGDSEEL